MTQCPTTGSPYGATVFRSDQRKVTICIAASCVDGDTPTIVICADMQRTFGRIGSSQTLFKNRWLVGGWLLAFAGLVKEENETSRHIRAVFAENAFRDLNETNVRPLVLEALSRRKREVGRIKSKEALGISFRAMRALAGRGEPTARKVLAEIAAWEPEAMAHYIICGISHGLIHLLETPQNGGFPVTRDQFAIVGNSQAEAQGVFIQQEHSEASQLGRALLVAYAAKKAAEERDVTIGDWTTIGVLQEGDLQPRYLKQSFIDDQLETTRLAYPVNAGLWPSFRSPPEDAYEPVKL